MPFDPRAMSSSRRRVPCSPQGSPATAANTTRFWYCPAAAWAAVLTLPLPSIWAAVSRATRPDRGSSAACPSTHLSQYVFPDNKAPAGIPPCVKASEPCLVQKAVTWLSKFVESGGGK